MERDTRRGWRHLEIHVLAMAHVGEILGVVQDQGIRVFQRERPLRAGFPVAVQKPNILICSAPSPVVSIRGEGTFCQGKNIE